MHCANFSRHHCDLFMSTSFPGPVATISKILDYSVETSWCIFRADQIGYFGFRERRHIYRLHLCRFVCPHHAPITSDCLFTGRESQYLWPSFVTKATNVVNSFLSTNLQIVFVHKYCIRLGMPFRITYSAK